MPTEKELMLKQADAETTYQKKLTAGTNITIDPVTNIISSAGGGSTVQYTDNTPNGESVGILAINGQSHPVRIPKLSEGTGITINKDITTNVYTISLSGGGGGTTKTYMGETNPDELVGEDGDLYFKYHKITTVIPTELTLPSLPDDTVVPFPITNFNSYDSFTFYCTDPSLQTTTINLNIGDIPIGDNPAELTPESEIHRFNTFYYAQVSRSTDGEGLVFRVGRNVLFKLEANVTEIDLGIDKSYAKVEDTWLPSGEQVEANPEETSQTPLTKIKIDGVTYYIAAGGSAEIVPLTKAEWDALPASKYTDNILYLITDSFTTETIITPNPEGEATDTLTKLQIDETIYSLAGESGAAAIEKTQAEYDALTPAQKTNGSIYMVQNKGEETRTQFDMTNITTYKESSMSVSTSISETIVSWNGDTAIGCTSFYTNPIDVTDIDYITYELETGSCYGNGSEAQQVRWRFDVGYASVAPSGVGNQEIFEEYNEHKYSNTVYTDDECMLDVRNVTGNIYIIVNSHGWNATLSNIEFVSVSSEAVNKIYYMGTEYANTNGGSGGGGDGYEETVLWTGAATASNTILALSDSITNYDDLLIYGATIFDSNGTITTQLNTTQIIPVSQIEYGVADEITKGYMYNVSHGQAIRRAVMIFTDASHFVVSRGGENDTTECGFTKVVGIKYGSGGGSGSDGKITTLAESQSTIFVPNDTITLSDSINNYDLIICFHKYSNGEIFTSTSISVEDLMATTLRINTYYGDVGYNYINYVDETTLTNDVQSNVGIYKIIGVKFGSGGGSSIIPNPEEEPTDTLNSVKIDGTVYNIESSSEGEGVEIYSENEYIVGSLNINGIKKKIYQKTFVLNNITVTQSSGYSYDITSLGIEDVVESPRGFVKITNSDRRSIPFNLLSGYGFTATVKPNQILLERAGNNITISQAVVTIRYTKTVETDAPAWGGSVNNYYANFIDTNNVIQAFTQISDTSEHTYTATEDCIVTYYVASQGDTYIKINNVLVGGNYSQGVGALGGFVAVKKGQTFSFQQSYTDSSSSGYTVYGISYGSGGGSSSESSIHYSTTEQIIGTWIDGKPLYQKSYENLNIGTVQNYSLTLSDLQNIEYLRVVPEGSQVSALTPFPYTHYNSNNNISYFIDSITNGVPTLAIRKGYEMSSQSNLQFLTIQYTKTTD